MRPTRCDVDLGAIAHNVGMLREHTGGAALCAVVKADGYGHGAVRVARTALDAGATWLGVALVEEGVELRAGGIDAPVLLLSEPPVAAMGDVAHHDLTPSVYSRTAIAAAGAAARESGRTLGVHLCVDTGMRRVGLEPSDLDQVRNWVDAEEGVVATGVWTHCPVADEPANPFTERQLDRFDALVDENELGSLLVHAGNSAVAIDHRSHAGAMVRCGIAMYGVEPDPGITHHLDLRPALSLRSEVSFVKRISAGEGVGYGHRWHAPEDRWLATIPIGYADGVRRDLGLRGGEVLIGGTRRPIVGVVTMDQLMVDLADDDSVAVGDEVVLLGRQGSDSIGANDIAARLGTIGYEVLCAIGARVPRRYSG